MSRASEEAIEEGVGDVNHVMVEDEGTARGAGEIADLVVDTRNWLPGRGVLVASSRGESTPWEIQSIPKGISEEQTEASPEVASDTPVNGLIRRFPGRP